MIIPDIIYPVQCLRYSRATNRKNMLAVYVWEAARSAEFSQSVLVRTCPPSAARNPVSAAVTRQNSVKLHLRDERTDGRMGASLCPSVRSFGRVFVRCVCQGRQFNGGTNRDA